MLSKSISAAERRHMGLVKSLPCSVCDQPGPSEAHHIKQGDHWTTVALCKDCHTGMGGWHGLKTMFRIRKMDELAALSVTIRRLVETASTR